jgi:hypothetical protein
MFSQNAGNAISETQILKYWGHTPPDHPRNLAPSALVSPLVSTPPKKTLLDPPLYHDTENFKPFYHSTIITKMISLKFQKQLSRSFHFSRSRVLGHNLRV